MVPPFVAMLQQDLRAFVDLQEAIPLVSHVEVGQAVRDRVILVPHLDRGAAEGRVHRAAAIPSAADPPGPLLQTVQRVGCGMKGEDGSPSSLIAAKEVES